MRRLLCLLLPLLALGLFAPTAGATGPYVNADGYYVYPGYSGYYWSGNHAYVLQYYTVPGYYSYGYYYPPVQRYRYVYSYTYYPPARAATTTYADANWRAELLKLAAARDKQVFQTQRALLEQAYFMDAVKTLGLQGQFAVPNYGAGLFPYAAPAYGYQNVALSTAGVNASTVYGTSYNQVAQIYGDTNLNALYQQAIRLAESSQKYGAQATGDAMGLVGQAGSNFAKAAEIDAKGRAAAMVFRALHEQSITVKSSGVGFKVEPGAAKGPPAPAQQPPEPVPPMPDPPEPEPAVLPQKAGEPKAPSPEVMKAWKADADARCAACHAPGASQAKNFNLADYWSLSREQRIQVLALQLTEDTKRRMPRLKGGGHGPKATPAQAKLWAH